MTDLYANTDPTDPEQLDDIQNVLLKRQAFPAFLHALKTCHASLFDKMKRQLHEKWKPVMRENPMDVELHKQYQGVTYTYSTTQQRVWSTDKSDAFQASINRLSALHGVLNTFKRACIDLKETLALAQANAVAAAAAGPGGGPAAGTAGIVLARGMAAERRAPPKPASIQMAADEFRFFCTKATNWGEDTNMATLSSTGQHQATSELFDDAFWKKITNKNRNDKKLASVTGDILDKDLILTLALALRLATQLWDEEHAKNSAAVSACNFFTQFVYPMLSGKVPLGTVAQQRDTYSSISDAYIALAAGTLGNHNRFAGCLMLTALSPEWREKVLKEMHATTVANAPIDGSFDPHEGLKTPVLHTFDKVWAREERLEAEKNALSPSKKGQLDNKVEALYASHDSLQPSCYAAQSNNQNARPRQSTPKGVRSSSGGRGKNEGKPKVHPGKVTWCTRCGQENHRFRDCTIERSSVHCQSCDVDGHTIQCCGTRLAEVNPDLVNPPPGWVDKPRLGGPPPGKPWGHPPPVLQAAPPPAYEQDRRPQAYLAEHPSRRPSRSPRRRNSPSNSQQRGRSPRYSSPGGTRLRRCSPSPQRGQALPLQAYLAEQSQTQSPPGYAQPLQGPAAQPLPPPPPGYQNPAPPPPLPN